MSNDREDFRRPSLGAGLAAYLRKAADIVEAGDPIPTGRDWVTITKDASPDGATHIQVDIWLRA